eukprot:c10812_g1_i3.p1 GENE.c10812_g1_i3~~c10812_g1_i3.p1  ORF type:complete len:199 (+),score=34.05 c10812_g1_i3:389-985(+)
MLSLKGNSVSDSGAQVLASALLQQGKIESLNLSGNNIGNAGVVALADLLRANYPLRQINLSFNQFGLEGARALGAGLQNSQLSMLDIRGGLSRDASLCIVEAVLQSQHLLELDLWTSVISTEQQSAIVERLSQNSQMLASREAEKRKEFTKTLTNERERWRIEDRGGDATSEDPTQTLLTQIGTKTRARVVPQLSDRD